MAFAEYEVVIRRDAMSVYNFLLDPRNLPFWRNGIRGVELVSGAACSKGAIYRPRLAATGRPAAAGEFQLTATRPGAEIQFQAIAGPAQLHGGYYLSTEGSRTRVRFALRSRNAGLSLLMYPRLRREMMGQVEQLEQLKSLLEHRQEAA